MLTQQMSAAVAGLSQIYTSEFTEVHYTPEQQAMVCRAVKDYIPLADFKATFTACADLMQQYSTERFIFDKTNLRVFHQPSMEWYFTDWKLAIYQKHGLSTHRKILPAQPWFIKAVEAGRDLIYAKHGKNKFNELDIAYSNSIGEALIK